MDADVFKTVYNYIYSKLTPNIFFLEVLHLFLCHFVSFVFFYQPLLSGIKICFYFSPVLSICVPNTIKSRGTKRADDGKQHDSMTEETANFTWRWPRSSYNIVNNYIRWRWLLCSWSKDRCKYYLSTILRDYSYCECLEVVL